MPLCALVLGWWLAIMATPFLLGGAAGLLAVAGVALFPFAVMWLRWRSLYDGIYSVAAWNLFTFSFLPGFLRSRVPPTLWIESTVVKQGPSPDALAQWRSLSSTAGESNTTEEVSA
jgi:hypothetical protein